MHASKHGTIAEPSPVPWTWTAALGSMIVCGLLFEVLYNGTNWITTQRSDVGTWAFAWESRIPFIPAMIVPYWTLNLFFVTSFFVCGTLAELRILRTRIALALFVACTCFLLFPLTLVFPRPEVGGFFGLLFAALRSFDQPHNLAPSLHIALRTIIWPVFIPLSAGLMGLVLRGWFVLIGISTLFTYQHQVMDVVTGWILALFCLHLVAERNPEIGQSICVRNGRVGSYYGVGSLLLIGAAWFSWPWGAWLIWPIVAMLLVTAAYFALGSVVFRKSRGKLPFSSRVLLAPVLFGHFLSLQYYKRQCRAWDEVVPGVWIGRKLNAAEAHDAVDKGVTAVVDLAAEYSEASPLLQTSYLGIPVLDLTAPTQEQLHKAIAFIESESQRGIVYVHCKIGYSRSAAIVGAYLLHTGRATNADEAIAMLRRVRPSIVIRPEARAALDAFADDRT